MELLASYFPGLTGEQLGRFQRYRELFLDWNHKINLISRKDHDNFEINHLLHSLAIAKFITFESGTAVLDVGTGGGLPGIPLAIYFPDVRFTLVDSIGKKIKVVDDLKNRLHLENVTAVQQRMENIRGEFDFITSRAVAPTKKLDTWLHNKISGQNRHARSNGYIFLKGGDLNLEMKESRLPYEEIGIDTYFDEPFFETKKIIYIPKK